MRSEVCKYAEAMEQELKNNEHKGTWKECEVKFLIDKLDEETRELVDAAKATAQLMATIKIVAKHDKALTPENIDFLVKVADNLRKWTLSEAADVGNIAMMIADVVGALPEDKKKQYMHK